MCSKKWVGGLAALVALVGGSVLFGQTGPGKQFYGWMYVQAQKAVGWAEDQVSVEDEIQRLTNEVEGLNKHKARLKDREITLRTEIKDLTAEVKLQNERLHKDREKINQLKSALDQARSDGLDYVSIEGVKSNFPVIRADLARRVSDFEKGVKGFEAKKALLAEKESLQVHLKEGIAQMSQDQEDLLTEIKTLKIKLEQVQIAEAQKVDSAANDELTRDLAHIRDSYKKVKAKVEARAEKLKDDSVNADLVVKTGIDQKVKADEAEDKVSDINKITLDPR